jgi:hypothetical protein
MYVYMYVCMCVYVYMYVCIYVCMYRIGEFTVPKVKTTLASMKLVIIIVSLGQMPSRTIVAAPALEKYSRVLRAQVTFVGERCSKCNS